MKTTTNTKREDLKIYLALINTGKPERVSCVKVGDKIFDDWTPRIIGGNSYTIEISKSEYLHIKSLSKDFNKSVVYNKYGTTAQEKFSY